MLVYRQAIAIECNFCDKPCIWCANKGVLCLAAPAQTHMCLKCFDDGNILCGEYIHRVDKGGWKLRDVLADFVNDVDEGSYDGDDEDSDDDDDDEEEGGITGFTRRSSTSLTRSRNDMFIGAFLDSPPCTNGSSLLVSTV